MAKYTKVFADPYPNGWKAKPDLSTPYTTTIRDNHDATLRSIEQYLYDNPIGDISQASIGSLKDVNLKYGYYDDQDHWDIGHVLKVKSYYDAETQTNVLGFVPVALDEINDLSDVSIAQADKVDGNVLTYDNTSGKLKLKAPSGGGGASYSTTEKAVGTDENGNTLYAKTRIEYNDPEYPSAGGGFSIIATKHRILKVEAIVKFRYNNSIQDIEKTWTLPHVAGFNPSYQNITVQELGNIYVENGTGANTVPTIYWDTIFFYNQTRIYPTELRVTAYYVKNFTT